MNKNQLLKIHNIKTTKPYVDLLVPMNTPVILYPEIAYIAYYEPQELAPEISLMDKIRKLLPFTRYDHKDEVPLPDSSGE